METNIALITVTVFVFTAGEELWLRFIPKYLQALGASVVLIGLFGSTRDVLDAVYSYPQGYISDLLGNTRSIKVFSLISIIGYAIYLLAPHWTFMFAGLAFVMVSPRLTPPAMFAIVANDLPYNRRVMGFTVLALVERVPEMLTPILGGLLITKLGLLAGIRASLIITISLAFLSVFLQNRRSIHAPPSTAKRDTVIFLKAGGFTRVLRRLLISDALVKTGERMVSIFIILYVMNVLGRSAFEVGILVAIQKSATMVGYIPSAWLADRYGRKPFVIASFLCNSLFPLLLVLAFNFTTLAIAFMISGFKHVGEPARKAMVVDLAEQDYRGRTVGFYHFIRSVAIAPAALVGGLLWTVNLKGALIAASCIGLFGTGLFILASNAEDMVPGETTNRR